jgi:anhydro-N-acetylmuramic acid kinase
MSSGVKKLYQTANKQKRIILGLMSGTSLDGLDLALCEFEGFGFASKIKVLNFTTKSFDEDFKAMIRDIFSKQMVNLEKVCIMNAYIGRKHAALINETLADWKIAPEDVDLIASHGQTIYHAPTSLHKLKGMPDSTLQIGDGDHIAVGTGIITLSDFRQKNIAAGAEGAPLAVYGDHLVFSSEEENRVLLNIGGISNFTFLPSDRVSHKSFSTDVGPGNTLMDAFIQANFPGKSYDKDAEVASSGQIRSELLEALLSEPFFDLPLPKSTGPELFNLAYLQKAILKSNQQSISNEDIMATLNRFTAESTGRVIRDQFGGYKNTAVYVSGGGMHNPLIIQNLQEIIPGISIKSMDDLGVHPDAKEAVLFALLANECLADNVTDCCRDEHVPVIRVGKISLPD